MKKEELMTYWIKSADRDFRTMIINRNFIKPAQKNSLKRGQKKSKDLEHG